MRDRGDDDANGDDDAAWRHGAALFRHASGENIQKNCDGGCYYDDVYKTDEDIETGHAAEPLLALERDRCCRSKRHDESILQMVRLAMGRLIL